MIKNNNQGLTLIELLVVALIIGILASMAMPAYFKAVERSRISEADTLIGSIVQAQQRYKMKTGRYTENWAALDIAPANAGSGAAYCTKLTKANQTNCKTGEADASKVGNGFAIELVGTDAGTGNTSGIKATRVGTGQYTYVLYKLYDETTQPSCKGNNGTDDEELCADYKGVDAYKDAVLGTEPAKKKS